MHRYGALPKMDCKIFCLSLLFYILLSWSNAYETDWMHTDQGSFRYVWDEQNQAWTREGKGPGQFVYPDDNEQGNKPDDSKPPIPFPVPGGNLEQPPGGNSGYPPGGSWGYPPAGSLGYPPGGSWGYPPAGSLGYPPGGSWGYPPGGSWGHPPGGSLGHPPGGSWGQPPAGDGGHFPGKGAGHSCKLIPIGHASADCKLKRRHRRCRVWCNGIFQGRFHCADGSNWVPRLPSCVAPAPH